MNVSISHGGRKAHKDASGGAGTKLPREVVQMAKQMGLDMSEMGEEAEAMWAKLNNLAQTDTEQYDNFIKEQMEEQEEAEDNPSRSFTPTAAFVVKTKFAPSSGTQIKTADNKFASGKIFVNVTSHDGIQRPLEPSGTPVVENRPHMDNMQIPLVVGLIRQTLDNSGEKVSVVDVVFNPWCITKSAENNVFRAQVVELALNWVQQEQSVKLERQWKVINSKYKGGSGPTNSNVLPFPVDEAMLSDADKEIVRKEREQKKEMREKMKKEMMGGEEEKKIETTTTEGLLDKMKGMQQQEKEEDEAMFANVSLEGMGLSNLVNLGGDKGGNLDNLGGEGKEKKKPIIEEVRSSSDKPKGKPLTKQMKGFLNKETAKEQGLGLGYEEKPSSGDGMGGKGGTYSKFMSRCKVVDTNGMSKEEQDKMMQQHADGSLGKPEKPAPPKPPPPPPSNKFDGMQKGFLDGVDKLYKGQGSSEGAPGGGEGSFDVEFQKLMMQADPAFASQFDDPRMKGGGAAGFGQDDIMTEALASMANFAEPGASGQGGARMGLDLDKIAQKATREKEEKSRKMREMRERMAKGLELDGGGGGKGGGRGGRNDKFKFEKKETAGGVEVVIDLKGFPEGKKLSMGEMELEVGSGHIVLNSGFGNVAVPIPDMDEDQVSAKLSQKKRTLTVKVAKMAVREKL